MPLLYDLYCADCDNMVLVEASATAIKWRCNLCLGYSYTSLPTDENMQLITDPALCGSLVYTSYDDVPEGRHIVQGREQVDTSMPQDPVEEIPSG